MPGAPGLDSETWKSKNLNSFAKKILREIAERRSAKVCGYGSSENINLQVYETRGGDVRQAYVECMTAPTPGSGAKNSGGG